MKENLKYIIITVVLIVVAFILKPERSAFDDCYYENKKFYIKVLKALPSDASNDAINRCK